MRDAFIEGRVSNDIRRRLLEEKELTFDRAFELAVTYSDARFDAQQFELPVSSSTQPIHAVTEQQRPSLPQQDGDEILALSSGNNKCNFCGSKRKHD